MAELGPWDGERAARPTVARGRPAAAADGGLALATWRLLLDNGSMQDGEPYLARHRPHAGRPASRHGGRRPRWAATGHARPATARLGRRCRSCRAPTCADGVVWVPANSAGRGVLADLGLARERASRVKGADQ